MKSTTLEVYKNDDLLFSSNGKWLYPLFELEEFLKMEPQPTGDLIIRDKIVGKASAMLIYRLGFDTVEAGTLSIPARDFFTKNGVVFTYDTLVDLIDCKTETLLKDINNPQKAYIILKKRAER